MSERVPFLTGEALRASLRGSACLVAEAAVNRETHEQTLDRLVAIAESAKEHWLSCRARDADGETPCSKTEGS